MNLSDLQLKEIIDVSTGKRLGSIIDVIVDHTGLIKREVVVKFFQAIKKKFLLNGKILLN